MKKICFGFFITLYIIISLIVTTCLLHYNDYNITVINGKSLISLKSDYDDFYIATREEAEEQINASESTYTLDNDKVITKDFIIGTKNNAKVYPVIGGILLLLESKWGFLGIVILPVAVCFIFEIYTLVKEFKPKKKRKKNEKK